MANPQASLLSELEFASWFSYAPRGTGPEADRGRSVRDRLKNDTMLRLADGSTLSTTRYLVKMVVDSLGDHPEIASLFSADCALVPIPRCSLRMAGGLWVPLNLCKELQAVGLGTVLECVERVVAVPKSAFAKMGERPTPMRHFESMAIVSPLSWPQRIVLVDDVITKGSTTIAAASRLRQVAPASEIVVFAMLRVMSDAFQFTSVIAPTRGIITVDKWGNAHRNP